MFKVGDLVRIKSCDEVIKINQKMGLAYPSLSTMEKYCNKIGKITKVIQYNSNYEWYWIDIDVSDDMNWRSYEVAPMKFNNFFPLRMWV